MVVSRDPVLLVVNSDNCQHCVPLMEQRSTINLAVKEKYTNVRCLWLQLDRVGFDLFPGSLQGLLHHVPIVLYFPAGVWQKYLHGESVPIPILNVDALQHFGGVYNQSSILRWLDSVANPSPIPSMQCGGPGAPMRCGDSGAHTAERLIPLFVKDSDTTGQKIYSSAKSSEPDVVWEYEYKGVKFAFGYTFSTYTISCEYGEKDIKSRVSMNLSSVLRV